MAMKWLRAAKPTNVHSSRSLTALDEPHACERIQVKAAGIATNKK